MTIHLSIVLFIPHRFPPFCGVGVGLGLTLRPPAHGDHPTRLVPGRLATLERYVEATGSAAVRRSTEFEGLAIGRWAESVTNRWRNGTLTNDQRMALEALPGWQWPEPGPYSGGSVPQSDSDVGVNLEKWNSAYERLERFVEEHGHSRVPARHRNDDGFTLGAWVGDQRRNYRAGELHDDLIGRLERLSGWLWSPKIGRPPKWTF